LLGNLISALVLTHVTDHNVLFYVYIAVASLGTLMFVALPRQEQLIEESNKKGENCYLSFILFYFMLFIIIIIIIIIIITYYLLI